MRSLKTLEQMRDPERLTAVDGTATEHQSADEHGGEQ